MPAVIKNDTRCFGHLIIPWNTPPQSVLRKLQGDGMAVVILTAGQGKRMKSYGPKSLIELRRGETVLSRQIGILSKRFPLADIIVVAGFDADKIYRHVPKFVRMVVNEYHEETNVVRSLDLGLKACIAERVLLVYGDLVFNDKTFADAPTEESWALIDPPTQGKTQLNSLEVGVTLFNHEVTRFAYGLDVKWGQIVFLCGAELQLGRRLASEKDRHRCFGFELLNAVLDKGGRLVSHSPRGMKLAEIDCSKDIEIAKRIT